MSFAKQKFLLVEREQGCHDQFPEWATHFKNSLEHAITQDPPAFEDLRYDVAILATQLAAQYTVTLS